MSRRDLCPLLCGDMHRSLREIGQPSGMVRVAVGKDDVGHLTDLKPQRFDLSRCSQSLVKLIASRFNGLLAYPLQRLGDVLKANPGVNQNQAASLFKHQAMTGSARMGRGMENPTVQMKDLHLSLWLAANSSRDPLLPPNPFAKASQRLERLSQNRDRCRQRSRIEQSATILGTGIKPQTIPRASGSRSVVQSTDRTTSARPTKAERSGGITLRAITL